MPGMRNLTPQQFNEKVQQFDLRYVREWNTWISAKRKKQNKVPRELGQILRSWQACRPNTMRRAYIDAEHEPPFLDDLLKEAEGPLAIVCRVEMHSADVFSKEVKHIKDG